ncbi:unnamed protein product [Alternaria alternata]
MPPGYEPTQGEVDDLIEKFSNIKINGMNAMLILQHLREAELLSNADVRRDVETALQRVVSVPARPIYNNGTQQSGPAKNRDADWHLPKAVSFNDDVTMEDQPARDKANKETPKKLRLLESLTTDPNEMVSQVLRAPISVSLQDLLAIAPELQKRIGKPFY